MSDVKVKEWSKKKLQDSVKSSITKMFEDILDFSEVAVGDDSRYKLLRSKILRIGNNAIRGLNGDIEKNYEVMFTGLGRDEVRINKRAKEQK
jgi:hypothetical protein